MGSLEAYWLIVGFRAISVTSIEAKYMTSKQSGSNEHFLNQQCTQCLLYSSPLTANSKTHGSDTETMTNAGGAAAEAGRPRRGNISSATAADGKTSRKRSGKRWEKRRDGERADADT